MIISCVFSFLAARVGRKRGKMNLEKTMNKNMFNMSTAIHEANPLVPKERIKTDQYEQQHDASSSPVLSTILSHPKQKLTTQFKRAITMIKPRGDPSNESATVSASLSSHPTIEKLLDSNFLASLIEEPIQQKDIIDTTHPMSSSSLTLTPKSPSSGHIKSQSIRSFPNQTLPSIDTDVNTSSSSATIITMDPPIIRSSHPSSPSSRMVKQSLQQIHSSILQTMHPRQPLSSTTTTTSSSSPATLSPTPTPTSTMGTGEVAILETIL